MAVMEEQLTLTGKYFGRNATESERESGVEIEKSNLGQLRQGGAGHTVLFQYRQGARLTAYDASLYACGDPHARRRESTRLLVRGFLKKDGHLPNPAPKGRAKVDAYVITQEGRSELARLGNPYE